MNQHEVYGTDSVNGLPAAARPQVETESPPSFDSAELLKGGREVLIRHHGEIYRLRLTRNDKLILNK
jgi:hemin uptake protein HemP